MTATCQYPMDPKGRGTVTGMNVATSSPGNYIFCWRNRIGRRICAVGIDEAHQWSDLRRCGKRSGIYH